MSEQIESHYCEDCAFYHIDSDDPDCLLIYYEYITYDYFVTTMNGCKCYRTKEWLKDKLEEDIDMIII